jgi:hypothetical protein
MLLLFRLGKGWKTQRLCALPKLLQQRLGIPSMKSYRENPEGEENQHATKQADREKFALAMMEHAVKSEYQAKRKLPDHCHACGMLNSQCECWDSVNGGN